jgi:hypothetical protein
VARVAQANRTGNRLRELNHKSVEDAAQEWVAIHETREQGAMRRRERSRAVLPIAITFHSPGNQNSNGEPTSKENDR